MTEEILTQLKSNVKELVKFLKEYDLTSANIQLSALGDLTVCKVEYSNETDSQECFTYFFDSKDFDVKDENKLDNNNQNSNNTINSDTQQKEKASTDTKISETNTITENENYLIYKESSDSKTSDSVTESHSVDSLNKLDFNSSKLDYGMIEPYFQESLIPQDKSSLDKNSTLENEYEINQNFTTTIRENEMKDIPNNDSLDNTPSKNSRLINFKEENDFQKETIMKILKKHNVLV